MAPRRVEVVYFPKRPKTARRASLEAPADPAYTRTVEFRPEFASAEEEPPTEQLVILPEAFREELAEAARPAGVPGAQLPRRRRTRSKETPAAPARAGVTKGAAPKPAVAKPAVAKPSNGKSPPGGSGREKKRTISLEIDTDPALRYHVRKLDELLSAPSPVEPLRQMSRHELAEMSLFGHQLFESGRLDEARVVFEGLVGLDVADAFPHTMLGTVYLAMGRPDRAAALFDAALAIDRDDLAARVYRAELRLQAGEGRRALQTLHSVVEDGPPGDPFVERAKRLLELAGAAGARRRR